MLSFEDIDLTDPELIDVQIAERNAAIDRMHGEIAALEAHQRRI
ncbi:hypothetical protein [Mycolicibacterium llatzerense]|nr:hypothetical protein [Mycolicibacterium llatzerense]